MVKIKASKLRDVELITDTGIRLGWVYDLSFDEETGDILVRDCVADCKAVGQGGESRAQHDYNFRQLRKIGTQVVGCKADRLVVVCAVPGVLHG